MQELTPHQRELLNRITTLYFQLNEEGISVLQERLMVKKPIVIIDHQIDTQDGFVMAEYNGVYNKIKLQACSPIYSADFTYLTKPQAKALIALLEGLVGQMKEE